MSGHKEPREHDLDCGIYVSLSMEDCTCGLTKEQEMARRRARVMEAEQELHEARCALNGGASK